MSVNKSQTIEQLKSQLEKLDQDRAALIRVIQLLQTTDSSPSLPLTFGHDESSNLPSLPKKEIVREVIRQVDGYFCTADIKAYLEDKKPDIFKDFGENTLSAIISEMAKKGEITRINGTYTRPHYKRTETLSDKNVGNGDEWAKL